MGKIKLFPRTDSGNAEHFAALYKDRVRYDHSRKTWFIWNSYRWRHDNDGGIYRLAKDGLRTRRHVAERITDDAIRQKEIKWTLESESRSHIDSLISLAQKEPRITESGEDCWDMDPFLLGTENGTINLRTGKLLAPNPEQKITKSVGYAFDSDAQSDLWERVFNSYWDNPEISRYIHKAVGYTLTGSIQEQCLFTLYGFGENGKSTFLGAIRDVLGEYSRTMPFSAIEMQSRSAISQDVAQLDGARFIMSSEAQEDIRLNEGRIKSLTGDSTITARLLYQNNFTYRPTGKLWLAFNHKPRVHDDSHGFWRRLKLIPTEKVFTDTDRIPDLEAKLKDARPAILNWAIKGCLLWLKEGLLTPPILQSATDRYREESELLREFFEECCDATGEVGKGDLYRSYRQWAKEQCERYPVGKITFGRKVGNREGVAEGVSTDGGTRIWTGISIKTTEYEVK